MSALFHQNGFFDFFRESYAESVYVNPHFAVMIGLMRLIIELPE
jgi:hypothetical protein